MGLISYVLSIVKREKSTDVKSDPGGNYNHNAAHYSAPGDDSLPLAGDAAVNVPTQRTGGFASVGYIDPNNLKSAGPGEKRSYSRNADGEQMAEAYLKDDGTIVIQNDKGIFVITSSGAISGVNEEGSFELNQGGTFIINGVTIDKDGNINVPAAAILTAPQAKVSASLKIGVTEAETIGHTHTSTTPGSPTGPFPTA